MTNFEYSGSGKVTPPPPDMPGEFKDPVWGAQQLRIVPIMKVFSDDDLMRLYKLGELRTVRTGSYALMEGEPTRGLFILLAGTVSVYKNDPASGTMHRLTFLEQGSHFGELSLFDHSPRSATIAAESLCHLFYLDANDFEKFLNQTPEQIRIKFYRGCAEDLSQRFRKLNGDYIAAQQLLWKHALRRDG